MSLWNPKRSNEAFYWILYHHRETGSKWFKPLRTGSNRFKVLSLVLKFDVYSRTNGIFFGRFSVFYTWKMWKSSIFIFKIFIFEFLSRIGLNLVVISLVGRARCLGGKARRPAETYQDPYIGEKSSNDVDKDISMNVEKLKILQKGMKN